METFLVILKSFPIFIAAITVAAVESLGTPTLHQQDHNTAVVTRKDGVTRTWFRGQPETILNAKKLSLTSRKQPPCIYSKISTWTPGQRTMLYIEERESERQIIHLQRGNQPQSYGQRTVRIYSNKPYTEQIDRRCITNGQKDSHTRIFLTKGWNTINVSSRSTPQRQVTIIRDDPAWGQGAVLASAIKRP